MADGTVSATAITSAVGTSPTPAPVNIAAVGGRLNLKGVGLSVGDTDGPAIETLDISVLQGSLQAVAGDSGVTISTLGAGLRLTGTLGQLNAFLGSASTSSFTYLDAGDAPKLTLSLSGANDASTGLTDVIPSNTTPTITAPAGYSVSEQDTISLKNTLTVSDPDGATEVVTLSVGEGTLTATPGNSGVSLTGSGTAQLRLTGTITQINAFLGASTSTLDYRNGSDTPSANTSLVASINDGQASGVAIASISVQDVNDAPTVTAQTPTLNVVEQVAFNLKAAGLSVADVDSRGAVETVILSVGEGVLTVAPGDSGVVVIDGSGSSLVTLRGTIAQINVFLSNGSSSTFNYTNTSDTPAASATLAVGLNDGGAGGPGARTGAASVTLNIGAVNDAPTIVAGGTFAAVEQTNLSLRGALAIGDVDAANGQVAVTLSVTQGTITVGVNGRPVTVTGNGTGAVTLTGTVAQLDAVLRTDTAAQVTYFNDSDTPAASVTVTAVINDGGNTGSGGAKTASTTFDIAVTAVNDGPDANISATTYAATEQAVLNLKNTGITVADADSGAASVTVVLSVTEGALTVTPGDSGAVVTGSGSGSVTITGAATAINALLTTDPTSAVSYRNASDTPPASVQLNITMTDNGATGTGGAMTDSDSATITIAPLNDAPNADAPDAYTAIEQTALNLKNTGLTVSDPDSAGASVTVTLTVGQGALTLTAGASGATVSGSGTGTVTLTGTVAQINNLLTTDATSTVSYFNNSDAPAATTNLVLSITDNGATGGGAQSDSDTAVITITPVNDGPTAIATQTNLTVTEGQTFSLKGQGFSIADPDAANSPVTVTLTVDEGAIDIDVGATGVSIVSGDNTGTVVLSGTIAQINSLLAPDASLFSGASVNAGPAGSVDYTVASDDPEESATFTLAVNDGGATGGGALTGSVSVAIDIVTVNDAPTIAFAGSITATEQVAASLKGFFTLDDVDDQGGVERLTLTVAEGVLNVTASTGVTVVSGNGTSSVVVIGSIDDLNTLLAANASGALTFTDTSNTPAAAVNLSLTLSDEGNTGDIGGVGSATRSVSIAVTAVNDAPDADIRVNFGADEQVEVGLKGDFVITDVDSGDSDVTATLSVTNGVLNVFAGSSGADVTGAGTSTVTIVGTVVEIRDLLNTNSTSFVRYVNNSDAPPDSAELSFTVNDGGATGTGGAMSDTDTSTIRITAVNDTPTLTGPATIAATEQTPVSLKGLFTANDPDGPGTLQTLVLTSPTGFTATAGNSGATVTPGDGNVTVTGTLAQIQAFLGTTSTSTLSYVNSSDTPPPSVAITATLTDAETAQAVYSGSITIAEVNDAPTATAPATYAVDEQASISLKGATLQIADVDDDGGPVTATLSVAFGTLTVVPGILGSIGVTVTGSGGSSVQLRGTVAQLNALLFGDATSQVTFASTSDAPPASTVLTLSVNDEGNGGPVVQTGQTTSTINIRQINDGPDANIVVTDILATERVPLSLKDAGLSVSDPDSGVNIVIATLGVGEGTITVNAGGSGATVAPGNNGTSLVTITGTVAQINALLNSDATSSITYLNNSDTPSALTTFILGINDTGSTGGGSLTDSDSANIRLTAVNSAPTNITSTGPFSTAENAAAGTVVGQVNGVDPDSTAFTYSLTNSASGRYAVSSSGAVTVANGVLLDFEQATSHVITVRATDSGGLFFDKAFTVGVTDVVGEATSGDAGANTILGGAGADTITGLLGADTLSGGADNDTLSGNQDNDVLSGNQGNDTLYGGQGDDMLYGGQGADMLFGNIGNDLLQGGIGVDQMSGGAGFDVFRFLAVADSPFAAFDTITDFEAGIDDIDLRPVRTGPADTFAVSTVGGVTYVDVDLGGNGSFEMRIALTGAPAVTSDDILFG